MAGEPVSATRASVLGQAGKSGEESFDAGHGNRYLARTLGNAVAGAGRTQTFLGARYRRLARRRGNKRAVVAVGRSMLVVIWHLLSDPNLEFVDLGVDYYELRANDPARKKREYIRHLEALGYKVSLEPAA